MNVSYKTAKLFLEGDELATAEVYQKYKGLLYFIISTYVDRKEDCEDVYQNVFLKILSNRDKVEKPSSLHQYLCTVAKNEAVEFLRKQDNDEPNESIEKLAVSESNSQLDYFLPYNLTTTEKSLVGYKITFGLKWKDILAITDMPIPTMKKKYSEALKKIKEVYENENSKK